MNKVQTIVFVIALFVTGTASLAQTPAPSATSKVLAFDHIVINVVDMERAIAFYKKIGFALINEDGWRKGQGQVAIKIGDSQKINIHKEEALGQVKAQALGAADRFSLAWVPVAGSADFCLVWAGTIAEAQKHLQDAGVDSISSPRRVTGARGPATSVYFRDPDGNLWEFIVYER